MSIIVARERLTKLAKDLKTQACGPRFAAMMIDKIVDEEMFRAVPVRRAPRKIAPLTDAQILQIRAIAAQDETLSQLEIANRVGTNPGRVSEVLNGKV